MIRSIEEYITSRVVLSDEGCWLWQGPICEDGYGQAFWPSASKEAFRWRAHRLAYQAWKGEIPEGAVLHHLCEVRSCVNPDHLLPTSVWDNTMRSATAPAAVNARKTHCPNGHEFTPANTYRPPGKNQRHCRTCHRRANREQSRKRYRETNGIPVDAPVTSGRPRL